MPEFTKGGRGKVAPYLSTHCRVPIPLKPLIDEIISCYKLTVQTGYEPLNSSDNSSQELIDSLFSTLSNFTVNKPVNSFKQVDVVTGFITDWREKSNGKEKQPRWANVIKLLDDLESRLN